VGPDRLLIAGEAEVFKGGIHLCLFGLVAMCLGYNAMAFSQRRERRLAVNVLVYAGVAVFELRQILQHLDRTGARK
jgi:hypothetical protein